MLLACAFAASIVAPQFFGTSRNVLTLARWGNGLYGIVYLAYACALIPLFRWLVAAARRRST